MDYVLEALTKPLDVKVRNAVVRRHAAMVRELEFMVTKQDTRLQFIQSRHWSNEKLSALFALNSFYQEVLGPLDASARARSHSGSVAEERQSHGLGSLHPILYGGPRFDSAHAMKVRSAVDDFFWLVRNLGFRREWISKNTSGDIVYWIDRAERENDFGTDFGGV